jgi:hypothetical protein
MLILDTNLLITLRKAYRQAVEYNDGKPPTEARLQILRARVEKASKNDADFERQWPKACLMFICLNIPDGLLKNKLLRDEERTKYLIAWHLWE